MKRVCVSGGLDDLRLADIRFLDEAAKLGSLHVALWSDDAIQSATGKPPKFPQAEREYFAQALSFVDRVIPLDGAASSDAPPSIDGVRFDAWAVRQSEDTPFRREWCRANQVEYRVIQDSQLADLPRPPKTPVNPASQRKKVVVTGCYDWFHTGHIRFFEECSELGDLYVVVGNDENVRALKGEGHPLFPAIQRRYIAGTIRYVKLALISSGMGWMDAEPEFVQIKPDIYAVNEDGDKPEKAEFCRKYGIEYKVLKRTPKQGLPRRQSTDLRGF